MWTHLDPLASKLEQVFAPLQSRASQFDRPWSIAELRLSNDDVNWLRSWFSHLPPERIGIWIKSMMPAMFEGDLCVTYRQMFGSLLICAGSEVCRESSNEDSVWPAIRSLLPESASLQGEIFLSNGQPSSMTKDVISDSVRTLNLRHAMDIEGTQQWFVTIKLQFGFTLIGARKRLAEWLVNLGRPHAVEYLTGNSDFPDLKSESFESLWKALTQYRKSLIQRTEARSTLEQNPWIRAAWIDELLIQSQERITTLGIGELPTEIAELREAKGSEEAFCPVASIGLAWSPHEAPRIRVQLDRQAIENEFKGTKARELDFYIDGKKICRWLRQQSGSWGGEDRLYSEPERERTLPNLNPKTLSIRSGDGEALTEWDLADSGISGEVQIFDLERNRIVRAGDERLDRNRRYAIICDRVCTILGAEPMEIFERNSLSKKAIRLQTPPAFKGFASF